MMHWRFDADRRLLERLGVLSAVRRVRAVITKTWLWTCEEPFPVRWPLWWVLAIPSALFWVLYGIASVVFRYDDAPDYDII